MRGHAVNDFIEYKKDAFFLSIIEASHFYVVVRSTGGGVFRGSGKTMKINSVHPGYLSMGM